MNTSTANAFALHLRSLHIAARRAQLIASNLANADTPNYKARDIDFRAALDNARNGQNPLPLMRTASDQLPGTAGNDQAQVEYRVPAAPSLDGNTVDTEMEQGAYAQNSLRYEADLTFISSQIRTLREAIKGQ